MVKPVFWLSAAAVRIVMVIALFISINASATVFTLSQSGWAGGGVLTGSFSGDDMNQDGYINLLSGEVSSYQVTFSGNALVPSFTHFLPDLQFFRYTVGSLGFRPSFPCYSTDGTYFYDADDYTIARNDLSVWISAFEGDVAHDAIVTVVPEPTAGFLCGAFLLAMLLAKNMCLSRRVNGPPLLRTILKPVCLLVMFSSVAVTSYGQGFPPQTGGSIAATNILTPVPNFGILQVDYEFFMVPDTMNIYYDRAGIYSSGLLQGAGQLAIPYGPGTSATLMIVVNQGNSPFTDTLWTYSASIVPEPGSVCIFGAGLSVMIFRRRHSLSRNRQFEPNE